MALFPTKEEENKEGTILLGDKMRLKYISFWQQKHQHPLRTVSSLKNTRADEQNTIILPNNGFIN